LTSAGRFGLINLPNSNTDMKRVVLPSHRLLHLAGRLLLGSCLIIGCSGNAQNKVYNAGFELPIGTNAYGNAQGGANFPLGTTTGGEMSDPAWRATGNWMIAYPWGGPDDFEIKDRNTPVHGGTINGPNYFSACLRPGQNKWMHAYYTQTITNLEAGRTYNVSGWMMEDRWKAVDDALRNEILVYLEVIGGQGTPTPDGRFSVLAVATDQSNLDAPYTYPNTSWLQFTNQQTPDANREIEFRLHHKKPSWCIWDKLELEGGYFDDVSLTP
jgi:hypothetical protein